MNGKGAKDFGGIFLIVCLLGALIFAYIVMQSFLTIFLLAAVLSIIAYPVYGRILAATRQRRSLSAFLTCCLVILMVILPALALLTITAHESVQIYGFLNEKVRSGVITQSLMPQVLALQQKYVPQLDITSLDPGKTVTDLAGNLSKQLIGMSTKALAAVTSTVWEFFLMLFALYYMLKEGREFLEWVAHMLPLSSSLEKEISRQFQEVSKSAFYGTFLTAILQGILGGMGFWIAGLPALVWGTAMAFFSLIPMVGTAIIWLPAALWLLLTAKTGWGIFLIVWGVVVVGMSDNLIRPLLMKGKNPLHPSFIFFSLIGGLASFGLLGILLGPLSLVLLLVILEAYESAARPVLDELDRS